MRLVIEKQDIEFGTSFTFQFENIASFRFFDSCIDKARADIPDGMKENLEIVQTLMHQRLEDPDIQSIYDSDEEYRINIPLNDVEFGNLMFLSFMAISAKYDMAIEELAEKVIPDQENKEKAAL